MRRSAVIPLAFALLPFTTGPAHAEAKVPLGGTFEGTFAIAFGPTFALSFDAEGQALHLGQSSAAGSAALVPVSPTCFQNSDEHLTLTAANGDTLELLNSALECLDGSVPGHLYVRGTAQTTILGGTGRFALASGSGTTRLDAEIREIGAAGASGTLTLTLDGTMIR